MEAAPPPPSPPAQVLISFSLDRGRREALSEIAVHHGLRSRAAVIREAGRVVEKVVEVGGVLTGHIRPLGPEHSGEGVFFPEDQVDALDAAAKQLGLARSTALRWACDALIDAHNKANGNGAH